jgi:hypothetical protein
MLTIGSVGLPERLLSLLNAYNKFVKLYIVQLTGAFGRRNYKLN